MIIDPQAMRMPLPVALFLLVVCGTQAVDAKTEILWCSISDEGSSNCSFASVAQCLSAVAGAGGYCMREAQVSDNELRAAGKSRSEAKSRAKHKQNGNLPIDIHFCRGC